MKRAPTDPTNEISATAGARASAQLTDGNAEEASSGDGVPPGDPVAPLAAASAYLEILPEIEALPASSIRHITVDIPRAVSLAMAALPALMSLRSAIEKLPDDDVGALDNLERYALGAWYAHTLSLPTTVDASILKQLLDEARPLRRALLVAAEALADRRLLDGATVAKIRSGRGNLGTANGLVALSALFTAHWEAVASKTAATRAEVDRAAQLAPQLLAALGAEASRGRAASGEGARERRARAYTLLVEAYDSCRRAVAYLRWRRGDADKIAPSLFKLVSPRHKATAQATPPGPIATTSQAMPMSPTSPGHGHA